MAASSCLSKLMSQKSTALNSIFRSGQGPLLGSHENRSQDVQLNAAMSSNLDSRLEAVKACAQIPSWNPFWSQKEKKGRESDEELHLG